MSNYILDHAKEELGKLGITDIAQPTYKYNTDSYITKISEDKFMDYWETAIKWKNYASFNLANIEIQCDIAKRNKEKYIDNQLVIHNDMLKNKYKAEKERRAAIMNTEDYEKLEDEYFKLLSEVKILKVIYQQYEDYVNLFSRELTRRTSSQEYRILKHTA